MRDGWVKIHRKILDSPLWKDCNANQKLVMITLLLMADHKANKWIFKGEEYETKPGQMVTSLKSIAEDSGLNLNIVRKSLIKFEKHNFCTSKSTNKNRLITILNWEKYQSKDDEENKQPNKQGTSKEQARNKQGTTNKNVRMEECKNGRNTTLTSEEVKQVMTAWNSFAQNKIHKISPNSTRYTHLRKRVEEDGLGEVLRAIQMTSESDFMQGKNNNGWVATFDWLMKPSNFQKTLEGNYRNKKKPEMSNIEEGLKILMNA